MFGSKKKEETTPREAVENYFLRLYNTNPVTSDSVSTCVEEARNSISRILVVPRNATVLNYTSFTRAPFTASSKDRECAPFYDACLRSLSFIAIISGGVQRGENIVSMKDRINSSLNVEWPNCSRCPEFQKLLQAGFGICFDDEDLVGKYYTRDVLDFLSSIILCCSSVCQSSVFQHVLECVGHVYIFECISKFPQCIHRLLDDEICSAKSNSASDEGFQSFLRLVSAISRFRRSDDFAVYFMEKGKDFIHAMSEFISQDMLCTFLDTMASLCRSRTLADDIYRRIDANISEVVTMRNYVRAINDYADDFSRGGDGGVLSPADSRALESILGLIERLCLESFACIDHLAKNKDYNLVHSILVLIHNSIPVSTKAKCFDCLSSLCRDSGICKSLWYDICNSPILSYDIIESGHGGILSDIEELENREHSFPLTHSFICFLSRLLSYCDNIEYDFTIYHRFMFEFVLMKLRQRNMLHFQERWIILSALCQCWTSLLSRPRQCQCLLRSAFCDSRFTDILVGYCLEDDAPEESLLCIFRLFLRLCECESSFRDNIEISDISYYVGVSQRLSWSDIPRRLVNCISSSDSDLQIICVNLAQRIGFQSKDIAQTVLSDRRSKPIRIFKKCIKVDEAEVEGELNVRNSILSLLVSFGGSSYFVRHVCGYDQSRPPHSLIESRLDKGILPVLLDKIKDKDSHKFVKFRDLFFELVRVLCENDYTRPAILNFLRSLHGFFNDQLLYLQDGNCLLSTIASFLRILSFESLDSESASGNVTTSTFEALFGDSGFSESRDHVVLASSLLSRVDGSASGCRVCSGFLDCVVWYMRNSSIVKSTRSNVDSWRHIWVHFLSSVLDLCCKLYDADSLNVLCDLAAFIVDFLVPRGEEECLEHDQAQHLFRLCISSLSHLVDLNVTRARLGIYSVLSRLDCRAFQSIFVVYEPSFVRCALRDLDRSEAILVSCVASACERVHVISSRCFMPVVSRCVDQFHVLWHIFDNDAPSGCFVLNSVLNLVNSILCSDSEHLKSSFVSDSILGHLCHDNFWHRVRSWYHDSYRYSFSDDMMRTACRCLDVISSMNIVFDESEDVSLFTRFFFDRYRGVFGPISESECTVSITSFEFLAKFIGLYCVCGFLRDDDFYSRCVDRLLRHIRSDQFRELIRDKSGRGGQIPAGEYQSRVDEIYSRVNEYSEFLESK